VKNQYVGDQNDFAKYKLLRSCATVFEEIVIAWMLTADDGLSDGSKIGYLARAAWRDSDPELFDGLAALIRADQRNVAAVEAAGLLPRCSFTAEPVPLNAAERVQYFSSIAARTGKGSLIFFDPDNGLEVASVPKHRRGAEKYLFLDELEPFKAIESSLLIYQHFPHVPRPTYLETVLERLKFTLGDGYVTFAAHTSNVAFLFAVREPFAEPLRKVVSDRCATSPALFFFPEAPEGS